MTKKMLAHDITAEELANWFGKKWRGEDHDKMIEAIARKINHLSWPGDPPSGNDLNALEWKQDDRFWDFKAVAEAAQLLHNNLPKIRAFWDGHGYFPELADIRGSLSQLSIELNKSLNSIVFPFGTCEVRPGRPTCSKPWHSYAIKLCLCIIAETDRSERSPRSLARNSILVRVIQRGLIRIGVPNAITVSTSALSRFLERWEDFYGLRALDDPIRIDHK